MLYLRSAARCGREQFPVIAMGKKNLTLRYTLTQFTFWAASTGAASFATTYLLGCGVPSGIIGVLLAAAGLLSCLTQPILAGIADKSKGFIVLKMMIGMSFLCVLCFSVQLISGIPVAVAGLFYMAGVWSSDAMIPFTNALCIPWFRSGGIRHFFVGARIRNCPAWQYLDDSASGLFSAAVHSGFTGIS